MPDRLGIGEHIAGDLSREYVLGHGQGRAVGPLEVVGSGCGSDTRISGMDQLERLGHPAVQQRAPRRADLAVCGGAEQVVDEVVARPAVGYG